MGLAENGGSRFIYWARRRPMIDRGLGLRSLAHQASPRVSTTRDCRVHECREIRKTGSRKRNLARMNPDDPIATVLRIHEWTARGQASGNPHVFRLQ